MKKRNRIRGTVAAVASLAALALAVPAGAGAAWSGNSDWDYKDSWYAYVHFNWTGPGTPGVHDVIADGTYANEVASQIFRHPIDAANTTYDQSTDTGVVAFKGSVRSLNEAHYIDIEFIDPRIHVEDNELSAVVTYRPATMNPPGWGSPTTTGRVVIATFDDLSSLRSTSGSTTEWDDAVPELTATGASYFSGGYPAGTAFGSIDFDATP